MKKTLLVGLLSLLLFINFGCQYENIVTPNSDNKEQSKDAPLTSSTRVVIQIYQNNSIGSFKIVDYSKEGTLWFTDVWHNFNTLKGGDSRNTFDIYISFRWEGVGTEYPFWGNFEFNGNSYFSYQLDNDMEDTGFKEEWHTNVNFSPDSFYSYKAWVESINEEENN